MIRRRMVALWAALLLVPALGGVVRGDLNAEIQAVLDDKLLQKAQVGIEVVRLTEGEPRVIYQHQPNLPLIPASNLKLVTTAAAMEQLGTDFRFRTLLAIHGEDLVLIGDGDPTLGDWELLRRYGADVTTTFTSWAEALKQRGITQVRHILVDDSVFDQQFVHPSWPTDQLLSWYEAPIGGLNLNANVLNFFVQVTRPGQSVSYLTNPATAYATITNQCTTGARDAIWFTREQGTNQIVLRGEARRSNTVPVAVTIHDPSLYAGTVLAETLNEQGVEVTGRIVRDRTVRAKLASLEDAHQADWTLLAIHETPIAAVLNRTNKDSMNLYAEALCKRIGFAASGEGSWATGTTAIGTFLRSLGVSDSEFALDDASGLSKENRLSANALAQVLVHAFGSAQKQVFIDSLAVAGVDGTLDGRFAGTKLQKRIFAKSGYVLGVSGLSGYLHASDGNWYAFSILMNGVPRGMNSGAKLLQERIVRAVDKEVR